MSELAILVDQLRPRVGAAAWRVRPDLTAPPAIRQLALPGPEEIAAARTPRRAIETGEIAAARALLRWREADAKVAPEPIDVEVLLALDPAEAFLLRQLFAVRPGLARGEPETWDRVDLTILSGRGLEAAGVIAGRVRSALWVRDSALVPAMVAATRTPADRTGAEAWLERHADLAAAWAICAGDAGAALLGWLLARGHAERVAKAFARVPGARDDLAGVLEQPFIPGVPYRLPADLPDYASAPGPLALREGSSLAAEDFGVLLRALSAGTMIGESAVVSALRRDAEPRALGDAMLTLLDAWLPERPEADGWVVDAVAQLGDSRAARALGRAYRACRRKKDPQAVDALDALASLATEMAIFELGRIAETERPGSARDRAWKALHALAASRGVTAERLIETALPSLELDARGERPADGVPGWSLVLAPSLTVRFRDPDGALGGAPRGKIGTLLKKLGGELETDAKAIASRSARRLERAMCDARPIAVERLRALIAHPIVAQVARALVWEDERGERFRIAEDGSAATADDAQRQLPAAEARVAHPVTIPAEERERWMHLLASYEILPPFRQLDRRVHLLPPEARAAVEWPVRGRATMPAIRVFTLIERGYRLDWAGYDLTKDLPGGLRLHLGLSPPLDPRVDPRTQGELDVVARLRRGDGEDVTLGALAPAPASELLDALGG